MPITDDVRKYGETVLEQGKVALDEARKPWYAAVGAGNLAVGQLQAQLSQLPAEVQAGVRKLQSAQLDPTAVRSAVENAAGQATTAYEAYAAQAREAYETLAHRGELVVRRLRRSPEVKETFDKAEELIADAGTTVATAEEKVTRPDRATTPKPAAAAKTAPARKAPAKRPNN
jgi:exonuclease VII small subunit